VQVVGGLFGKNLTAIAVIGNDKLWFNIADSTAPSMTVIDTMNDCIEVALIDTGLNLGKVVFC
jgi:hypothetical protein